MVPPVCIPCRVDDLGSPMRTPLINPPRESSFSFSERFIDFPPSFLSLRTFFLSFAPQWQILGPRRVGFGS